MVQLSVKMKLVCLLLLPLLAIAWSEIIDVNDLYDRFLESKNEAVRKAGATTLKLPPGKAPNIEYSEGTLIGLDSLVRTENCTLKRDNGVSKFDLHYGLGLWVETYRSLKIYGDEMSGVFRINDNSIHYSFTIHHGTYCNVTLEEFRLERLAVVDFAASRLEYDGLDVDDIFEEYLLPKLNQEYFEPKKAGLNDFLDILCFAFDTNGLTKALEGPPTIRKIIESAMSFKF